MLRCAIGSTGAKGVAPARLTSSLDNGMLIAPMLDLISSVQPVPLRFPHLIAFGAQTCTDAWASVLPTTIGCTDGAMSVYPVLQILHHFRPIRRGNFLDSSNIFYLWIFTILWHLHYGLDSTS